MTHYWCLGIYLDPEDGKLIEGPVAGDYGWGPADQVVELEDGVPAQGVWVQFILGFWVTFVVSRGFLSSDMYKLYILLWD